MKLFFKSFSLALGVLTLLGCAGPPAQYYTLSREASQSTQPLLNAAGTPGRVVGPYTLSDIGVPAEVDKLSLVVRQGDGRLMVLNEDRWTGSLSAQISTALSQSLTQRVGMPPIQKYISEAVQASVTKIQLDVQRFDLIPGRSVALDAVWSIRPKGSKAYLTCYTRLEQPVGIGVLALVQGQQANVQALAQELAETLQSGQAPRGSRCTR